MKGLKFGQSSSNTGFKKDLKLLGTSKASSTKTELEIVDGKVREQKELKKIELSRNTEFKNNEQSAGNTLKKVNSYSGKTKVNKFFEIINTPEKAYCLGYIINNSYINFDQEYIIIHSLYEDDLNKIKSIISTNRCVVRLNKTNTYSLKIESKGLLNSMKNILNQSYPYATSIPNEVPDRLHQYFVLGYITSCIRLYRIGNSLSYSIRGIKHMLKQIKKTIDLKSSRLLEKRTPYSFAMYELIVDDFNDVLFLFNYMNKDVFRDLVNTDLLNILNNYITNKTFNEETSTTNNFLYNFYIDFNLGRSNINKTIYGLVMGDGSIKNNYLNISHSSKQKEYSIFLNTLFDSWGLRTHFSVTKNGGNSKYSNENRYSVSLKLPNANYYTKYDRTYINGKKIISAYCCKHINVIALLFWYLDDGNLSVRLDKRSRQAVLCTYGYSKNNNNLLSRYLLKRFKLESTVRSTNKGTFFLRFKISSFRDLYKMTEQYFKYLPKCLKYKFDLSEEDYNASDFGKNYPERIWGPPTNISRY